MKNIGAGHATPAFFFTYLILFFTETKGAFTPASFGPDLRTFQFDPNQNRSVKPPLVHDLDQTAETWSNQKMSGSNQTMVQLVSSVKANVRI